jgi:hypothetical protein
VEAGWRFWFRLGDRLIAPFEGEIAEGPLIAAYEPSPNQPSPGIHYAPRVEDLFAHPLLRFWLAPESVDPSTLNAGELGNWQMRGTPFALTFGAALGDCQPDPHPLSRGTVMRAEGYRIVAALCADVAFQESLGARYGCAIPPGVSMKWCRHVEATLGPRLADLAAAPLPPAGKTRLVWHDGRLTEMPVNHVPYTSSAVPNAPAPIGVAERIQLLAQARAAVGSFDRRRNGSLPPSQLLTPEQQTVLRQLGQSLT